MRVVLILILIVYALYKLGLFRFSLHTHVRGQQNSREYGSKPRGGNVHVDSVPNQKKKETIKGGEYVDYEEIK